MIRGRSPKQPFRISPPIEHDVFKMFGRFDGRTLPLLGSVHVRMAPPDSPVRYLLDGYPWRPELRGPNKQGKRLAYSVGVIAGAVAVQGQLHVPDMVADSGIHMPPDPSKDVDIARIRSLAIGSRFWLQPFFETPGDVLVELLNEVEEPLLRRHVDLGLPPSPDGRDKEHHVVIGAGDIVVLCAVILDSTVQPGTLPLLRSSER